MKKKLTIMMVMTTVMMFVLTACTAVQVSSHLKLNKDGSGSRRIEGYIAKQDHQDGYGSAYYYFKKHGADLEAHIKGIYSEKVAGSEEWLMVSVDDSKDEWEIITLYFEFESFLDYTSKLSALCYDETASASYAAPEFEQGENDVFSYKESTNVMTSIFKSLQADIMADDSIYDPSSTKDGVALNDGSADGQLEEYGVEIMKEENGDAMTIQFNGGEAAAVEALDGFYMIHFSEGGEQAIEEQEEVSKVLHYTFDDTLANSGTAAENDLIYGKGSTENGPTYEAGMNGNAFKLDGSTYLASPNKSYHYKEMTISFYYRFDEYTETDTGANMVIVPAGLGALGAGVIDIEFINEGDGIKLLSKMNSSDWQTQDKLYSEGYIMEAHLSEWHNYTFVYKNEYDDDGSILDSYVYMYIDGKLAERSKLFVAAGLTYSLGSYDDGSLGEANGGFNLGGYYENGTVKRTCTGLLDDFMVFNGALSEDEIMELIYTTKVDKEYDPNVVDVIPVDDEGNDEKETQKETPTPTASDKPKDNNDDGGGNTVLIVIAAAIIVLLAVVIIINLRKKKTK